MTRTRALSESATYKKPEESNARPVGLEKVAVVSVPSAKLDDEPQNPIHVVTTENTV